MKARKRILLLVLVCVCLCAFVCSGVTLIRKTLSFSLSFDGEPVFEKTYPLPFSRALRLGFYGYDLQTLCQKRFSGDVEACFGYLHPSILMDVESVCHRFDRPATEPTVAFSESGFSYTEGQNGLLTDVPATLSRLLASPSSSVVYAVLTPEETVEDLKKRTVSVSFFSTSYASSSPARKKNVALAASRLSGLTVLPGEELSFNQAVGARTTENGFYEAPVIENGVYSTGVGGGVCQVATTLYDAWLYADRAVTYSRPHSLTPHYVTPGLDAMVSSSGDLVLKNDSPYPVYIRSYADGNLLSFEIFGEKPACDVSLRSVLVKTIPCDEYETVNGDEDRILFFPKPSTLYHSYRIRAYPNGQTSEEFLRASFYLPQKGKKSVSSRNNDEENGSQ